MGLFSTSLKTEIEVLKEELAKNEAVFAQFPDAELYQTGYRSKLVNEAYKDYEFAANNYCVSIQLSTDIKFSYNDTIKKIKVFSNPMRINIAQTNYIKATSTMEIMFFPLSLDLQKTLFAGKLATETKSHLIKFIKDNPTLPVNTKNIDPSFQQLLLFI